MGGGFDEGLWFDKLTMSGIGGIGTGPGRSAMTADAKWVRVSCRAALPRIMDPPRRRWSASCHPVTTPRFSTPAQ